MGRPASGRLASVDALRGGAVAAMILVNSPGDWGQVWWPLEHAAWNGFTPTDLVFPLFLFVVGVSLALATGKARDQGDRPPLRPLLWRAARLVALGLVLHAVAHLALATPAFRPLGVLQRIGLCFGAAAWLICRLPRRYWWAAAVGLLLLWGGLLWAGGPMLPLHHLAARVDVALLGSHVWQFEATTGLGQDPEGVLSTLGALATTWLGVLAGEALRQRRLAGLVWGGLLCWLLGALAQAAWPWNKTLWTPSFVLWAGGWSVLLLAAVHEAVDRQQGPAWGRRFGINAITAYAGSWLLTCALDGSGAGPALYARLAAPLQGWPGPLWTSHGWALLQVGLWWGVMVWLDRRRIVLAI